MGALCWVFLKPWVRVSIESGRGHEALFRLLVSVAAGVCLYWAAAAAFRSEEARSVRRFFVRAR
jgi:hypothetical protein